MGTNNSNTTVVAKDTGKRGGRGRKKDKASEPQVTDTTQVAVVTPPTPPEPEKVPVPQEVKQLSAEELQAQVVEAAKKEASERKSAESEAEKVLEECAEEWNIGLHSHATHAINSGRLAQMYMEMTTKHPLKWSRESSIKKVSARLSGKTSVDANRLIDIYNAWRLLTDEGKVQSQESFECWRDIWSHMTERKFNHDSRVDEFRLWPGFESRCRELFADSVAQNRDKKASDRLMRILKEEYAACQKAITAQQAVEAAERAKLTAAQTEKAKQDLKDAEAEKQRAELAAAMAKEEDKAKLTLVSKEKEEALRQAQRDHQARVDAEIQATRDRMAAENEAKRREDKHRAAQESLEKIEKRASGEKPPVEGSNPNIPSIHDMAKRGTAQDVAGFMIELIQGCEYPRETLQAFFREMQKDKDDLVATVMKASLSHLSRAIVEEEMAKAKKSKVA